MAKVVVPLIQALGIKITLESKGPKPL